MAIGSGFDSLSSIHRFSNKNCEEICRKLEIPLLERKPCYNVFRNAFKQIGKGILDEAFNKCFSKVNCQLVHIDGKASKGTIQNANDSKQHYLKTVSAYSSEEKKTIRRESFDTKDNSEVKVARGMIRDLEKSEGGRKIVTTDSAHCNKETIGLFENHEYLIQFKGNQKKLKEEALRIEKEQKPLSTYYSSEWNKGRFETRFTKVYSYKSPQWPSARSIVIQERTRDSSYEKAFFLSNKLRKASVRALHIRSHWSVETMHWEKDILLTRHQTRNLLKSTLRGSSILN